MKNLLRLALSLLCMMSVNHLVMSQETMKSDKQYKNIVRLNITNPLIFGDKSLVVGYERVLGPNKSFSLNIGQSELPEFSLFNPGSDDPEAQLTKNTKGHGFNLTADFRFYLKQENKFNAPHGIYLAPYVAYATMGRENTWTLHTNSFDGEVVTDFNLNFLAIGGELGYQFVLWKRVALDFILIGPSLARYKLEAKVDTSLDPDDEALLFQKINDALEEKFPGYSFAIDGSDFEKTGTSDLIGPSYRYVIHLGFLF
jgi:hypothetical protein